MGLASFKKTNRINGVTLCFDEAQPTCECITKKLEHIRLLGFDTVNLYGLEMLEEIDFLFTELERIKLSVVVRIESYSHDFSFQQEDLNYIFNYYAKLLDKACAHNNKSRVAYFALNMPVDDPAVTARLGGVNTRLCRRAQKAYAAAFVSAMRFETHKRGYYDAKLYLSIFYGWDNTFDTPSYCACGCDGYFLNNYSYPVNEVPSERFSEHCLINQARLELAIKRFKAQYRKSPLIVEFGFHTLEYNKGEMPAQTAGLVLDRKAKEKAIKATLKYYATVEEYCGFLYFAYDLYKKEGVPPAVMDWTLEYNDEMGVMV